MPEEAEQLEDEAFAIMPHLKITELLLEVDQWVELTPCTHLRNGDLVKDLSLLLTVILAVASTLAWYANSAVGRSKPSNEGENLTWKMAIERCPFWRAFRVYDSCGPKVEGFKWLLRRFRIAAAVDHRNCSFPLRQNTEYLQ